MKECKYLKEQEKCPNFDVNRQDKFKCLHLRFNEFCSICPNDKSYKGLSAFKDKNKS
jgi:hypothetical protein